MLQTKWGIFSAALTGDAGTVWLDGYKGPEETAVGGLAWAVRLQMGDTVRGSEQLLSKSCFRVLASLLVNRPSWLR